MMPAGIYQGQQIGGIDEWIMCSGKIPMAEYQKFAAQYDPTNYNADEWVRLGERSRYGCPRRAGSSAGGNSKRFETLTDSISHYNLP